MSEEEPSKDSDNYSAKRILKIYNLEGKNNPKMFYELLKASYNHANIKNKICVSPENRKKYNQFPFYIRRILMPLKDNKEKNIIDAEKLRKTIYNLSFAFLICHITKKGEKQVLYVPRAEIIDASKQIYNCKKRIYYWEISGDNEPDWWPQDRYLDLDQIVNNYV